MMIQTNRICSKSTIMICLLIVALTHDRFCNSFSISLPFSSPPSLALSLVPPSSSSEAEGTGVQIANVDPLILAISNVLSSPDIQEMLQIIHSYEEIEDEGGDDPGKGQGLIPTVNYQEDVFSKDTTML
uniref:Subtilisin n=1 Tax=Chaetoceros debilis TaxID=122233 RepID=A0A6S8ZKN2_9STRA